MEVAILKQVQLSAEDIEQERAVKLNEAALFHVKGYFDDAKHQNAVKKINAQYDRTVAAAKVERGRRDRARAKAAMKNAKAPATPA